VLRLPDRGQRGPPVGPVPEPRRPGRPLEAARQRRRQGGRTVRPVGRPRGREGPRRGAPGPYGVADPPRSRMEEVAAMTRFILAPVTLVSVATRAAAADRPNVVLILADALGREDCGFMGGTQIRTPHIDRLDAAGARLGAHYAQPVCSPTR